MLCEPLPSVLLCRFGHISRIRGSSINRELPCAEEVLCIQAAPLCTAISCCFIRVHWLGSPTRGNLRHSSCSQPWLCHRAVVLGRFAPQPALPHSTHQQLITALPGKQTGLWFHRNFFTRPSDPALSSNRPMVQTTGTHTG